MRAGLGVLVVSLLLGCSSAATRHREGRRCGGGTLDLTEGRALSDAALLHCIDGDGVLAIVRVTRVDDHMCRTDDPVTLRVDRVIRGQASGSIEATRTGRSAPTCGYSYLVHLEPPWPSYRPAYLSEFIQLDDQCRESVIAMHEMRLEELRRRSASQRR